MPLLGDARSNQVLAELYLKLNNGIDMSAVEQINPKLKIVLSNLVDRNDVFKMEIDELREYFTDKLTKKLKQDVLYRIGDLFDRMKEKKAADARRALESNEEIPYACKILKPKEAFSLSLSKLDDEKLKAMYDKAGVVIQANKINGMVLVMFSEKEQVWVPRKGVLRTGKAPAAGAAAAKKYEKPLSYISAAHLREKSPGDRERSRSRSTDKKIGLVRNAKELEAAKQRTRARLKTRMKKKRRKRTRQRAKSQDSAPKKGRGALFANDAAFPISMPRARANSLTEVKKYQQQKNRITIGGLLKKTRDSRAVIERRNFKERRGTGKVVSYDSPGSQKQDAGEGFEEIGSYAPYEKLHRMEKAFKAQQLNQQDGGGAPRKQRLNEHEDPYQHPIYGNINIEDNNYEHPMYSTMKQPDWEKLPKTNDGGRAGAGTGLTFNEETGMWAPANENNEGPWGANQGWGADVVPEAGAAGATTADDENVDQKDKAMDYDSYHDRLFSQHLDGMNNGSATPKYKDSRTLLERLSDKKNRVTLANLKDQKADLVDQLKRFDMHAKVKKNHFLE